MLTLPNYRINSPSHLRLAVQSAPKTLTLFCRGPGGNAREAFMCLRCLELLNLYAARPPPLEWVASSQHCQMSTQAKPSTEGFVPYNVLT